jgi:iron complex transport system ATP-binding protein
LPRIVKSPPRRGNRDLRHFCDTIGDVSEDAIDLRNVSLIRGDTHILRNLTWRIPRGCCAAILGPNGSGKSTLTRILACHLWPSHGDVVVLGQPFGQANLLETRRDVRLVQAAGPYDVEPELTAREVVLTGFFSSIGLYDPVTSQMQEDADRLLGLVGLNHVAGHKYATLSSGERVRSLIARALAVKPRLLLLDEPTSGLDLLAREQVLATVEMMFQPGATDAQPTVILITHHVEELPPATMHVLLLDEGRVAAQGSPADVLRSDVLSRVYRCPLEVAQSNGRYRVEVHPAAWADLLRRGHGAS